jgi:diguanylate cyclase
MAEISTSPRAFDALKLKVFVATCLLLIISGILSLLKIGADARLDPAWNLILSLSAIGSVWTLLALWIWQVPLVQLEKTFMAYFIVHAMLRVAAESWYLNLPLGTFALATPIGIILLLLGLFIALPVRTALRFSVFVVLGFILIPWSAVLVLNHLSPHNVAALIRAQISVGLILGMIYILGVSKSAWYAEQVRSELLNQLAHQDPLTGIANRRHLMQVLSEQQHYALILFDLDHFKRINDTLGHDTGDLVLRKAVELAKTQLRNSDHMGRLGGEEFLIILPEAKLETAKMVAERIRQAFSLETTPPFTASFGVTENRDIHLTEALHKTDQLLYKAKSAGRNVVID